MIPLKGARMAYFEDLSDYTYADAYFYRPGTTNIGWLGLGIDFNKMEPDEEPLGRIWEYCTISVAQMRGLHLCELCSERDSNTPERDGRALLLGSAEIRVFSKSGDIYAAPNLIYHYVSAHRYRPPDAFIRALSEGPSPPGPQYFDQLSALGLEWGTTSRPGPNPVRFRIVRTEDGVKFVYD
jgi:hypothetical protein